ncbi:hypothetical protein MCAP1_002442, partial [Malassezia caprae]
YFHFIDLALHLSDESIFPTALEWVRTTLPTSEQRAMVIVSDLSSLAWSTQGPSDVVVNQSIQWL